MSELISGLNSSGIKENINVNNGAMSVYSKANKVSASFTRPNNTDIFTAKDVVGTNPATVLTFANVSSVSGGTIIIAGASLRIDVNAVPSGMGAFRVHLYNASPTAIADNAAFNLPSGDRDKYMGYIEFTAPEDIGDTLWSQAVSVNMAKQLASGSTSIYGMLETVEAYTPSAQAVNTIILNVLEV